MDVVKQKKATKAQEDWIKGYIDEFFATLSSPDINDPDGYTKYIDVGAWVDHHLINVLTFNVDALRLSAYFFKDRNKVFQVLKLHAPVPLKALRYQEIGSRLSSIISF